MESLFRSVAVSLHIPVNHYRHLLFAWQQRISAAIIWWLHAISRGNLIALSVPPLGQVYWRLGALKIDLGVQKSLLERFVTHFLFNVCCTCNFERSEIDLWRILVDFGLKTVEIWSKNWWKIQSKLDLKKIVVSMPFFGRFRIVLGLNSESFSMLSYGRFSSKDQQGIGASHFWKPWKNAGKT